MNENTIWKKRSQILLLFIYICFRMLVSTMNKNEIFKNRVNFKRISKPRRTLIRWTTKTSKTTKTAKTTKTVKTEECILINKSTKYKMERNCLKLNKTEYIHYLQNHNFGYLKGCRKICHRKAEIKGRKKSKVRIVGENEDHIMCKYKANTKIKFSQSIWWKFYFKRKIVAVW